MSRAPYSGDRLPGGQPPAAGTLSYYDDNDEWDIRAPQTGRPPVPFPVRYVRRPPPGQRVPYFRAQISGDSPNAWLRRGSRHRSGDDGGRPPREPTRDWMPQPVMRAGGMQSRIAPRNLVTRELPVEEVVNVSQRPMEESRYFSQSPPPLNNDEERRDRNEGGRRQSGEGSGRRTHRQGAADDVARNGSPTRSPMFYNEVQFVSSNRASAEPATYETVEPYEEPEPYQDRDEGRRSPPYPAYRQHRPSSPMSDTMDPYDKFQFELPARSATEDSKEGDLSDPDTAELDETSTQRADTGRQKATSATRVYTSHYTGNAELGGNHNATLTVLHDPKGEKQPLFRWLHIKQTVMNLDDFWAEVAHQPRLSEAEKTAIAKLRADVKRQCVKSRYNPKGSRVGYMDPRSMEIPLKSEKKKGSSDDTSTGSVKWICIPYFTLQQYSGLLAASNLASFPSQTLLQAQYTRTPQQRDMDQAVCQLGTANRGECFHIAQLWCLVLDNSFLVTCGNISQADLQGESLQVKPEPSREPTTTASASSGRIFVLYGDVTWSFTAAECPTWFSFMSFFQAFWPSHLEFRCGHLEINAKNWFRVLKLASRPRGSVSLKMKTRPQPEPPTVNILKPENPDELTAHSGKRKTSPHKHLAVLTLLHDDEQLAENSKDSPGGLGLRLAAADKFLMGQTSSSIQQSYTNCPEATRDDVYTYLSGISAGVEQKDNTVIRRSYEDRVVVFNSADMLYRLFFPTGFCGPTVDKFWGAIKKVVHMPELEPGYVGDTSYDDTVTNVKDFLLLYVQDIQTFESIVSDANVEERAKIELPPQFITAWLHAMTAMMYCMDGSPRYHQHAARVKYLILKGMDTIVEGMSGKDLLDKAAVLPMEVLSLIAMNLLADQVGKADDICETYSQYLNSLDTDITTKPSDRSYQHRINLVQQEMTVIKRTMAKQRSIINYTRSSLTVPSSQDFIQRSYEDTGMHRGRDRDYEAGGPPAYYQSAPHYEPEGLHGANDYMGLDDQFAIELASAAKLSPTDASGFRGLLLSECMRLVEQREFEFRRYTEYAEDLERAIVYKMDWTKDRQENAIYAFTIVTIVFLPLSSIAGIFGMNTSDVRDMEVGQWLYWAVALPVTLGVIIAGLWWMGELGNFAAWVTGRGRSRADPAYPTSVMMAPPGQPSGAPPPPQREDAPIATVISAPAPMMGRTYNVEEAYQAPVTRMERHYMDYPTNTQGRMQHRTRPVYRY